MSLARLYVLSGPDVGRSFLLRGPALVGRGSDCDVRLRGTTISRRHARIEPTAAGWAVVDQGSTNGLRRGGRRVADARLGDHDEFFLGDVHLRIRVLDGQGPGEAGPASRRAERAAPGPRADGGLLGADLAQRPWWVQLLLVLAALGLAAALFRAAFALARRLSG